MYKVLAYDVLNGYIAARESPLFHFQRVGYEAASEMSTRSAACSGEVAWTKSWSWRTPIRWPFSRGFPPARRQL